MTLVEWIMQNGWFLLAVVALAITWIVSANVKDLKVLLSAIFLDIEKQTGKAVIAAGPDQMAAAINRLFDLIPPQFALVLNIVALLFHTSRERLAAKIAQSVYDEIRARI